MELRRRRAGLGAERDASEELGHPPVFSPPTSTVPSTAATEVTSPVPGGKETGGAIDCRVLC